MLLLYTDVYDYSYQQPPRPIQSAHPEKFCNTVWDKYTAHLMLEIKKVCYERGNILAIIRESIK